MKKYNEKNEKFARIFRTKNGAQLLVMLTTMQDKTIIESTIEKAIGFEDTIGDFVKRLQKLPQDAKLTMTIVEEVIKKDDSLLRNVIDFIGDDHKESAYAYLSLFDEDLAQEQYESLVVRMQAFLNPEHPDFLNPHA